MKFMKRRKADASASTEPPKERYGLFFLHNMPNADVDIVAVHGLGGHFEETWTDSDSKQLWLRDFLPSQLEEVGITARIMSYGYDSTTAFSKSVTGIEDQARILIDALSLERESQSEKNRPLIFIAHSLGGIIVKKVMIIAHERSSLYAAILNSVQALAFFGVPHRGSDLAYWSAFAARLMHTVQMGMSTNMSFVEALKRNSQAFAEVSQSFIERAAPLRIRRFYETERIHGYLIVDKGSARLDLPNENAVGVIAADHRTICKFNNKDSQRYRPVWKAIQILCSKMEENTASSQAAKSTGSLFLVPFPRDPLFCGRKSIINSINANFKTERRVALTGIGGVGKSQIAIEYCYQFKERQADSNVFWIHASTKERFEQAFKAISRKLQLSGWNNPDVNPLDLVSDWLSGDTRWLLILDNADDSDVFFDQPPTTTFQHPESQSPTMPLVMYIPQTSRGGSILITSRNRDAAFRLTDNVENLIDVPYMIKEDATTLLCNKLPKDNSSDEEKFELVDLLEYLPLAITQAASYISVRRTRMTVARYSNLLRKSDRILLDDMGDLRRDPTIPSSVLLTWHISFDQINKENRSAAELLSVMSVLDRQGIPQYVLQNKDEDDFEFEKRLAPLEEFSLITLDDSGQSFQMHRLVQMAIRSWLKRHGEIDHWKQNATNLITKVLPSSNYKNWKTWETLLPHSEVVLEYNFPNRASQLLHAKVLFCTASYLTGQGKYDTATERCQHALNIQVDIMGEGDIGTVDALLLLARLKSGMGANSVPRIFEDSEILGRRAIEVLETKHVKDSDRLYRAQNQLAISLLMSGHDRKVEEGTTILRSMLVSEEQSLGVDHPRTLGVMHNIATAFRRQEKYIEAEMLHRKALESRLRTLDDKHPSTLDSMYSLARVLHRQKRHKEAQEYAQRALDLQRTVLGEKHEGTLITTRVLIDILHDQGSYREAEELCRYTLILYRTLYGDFDNRTLYCGRFLGDILLKQHKFEEAEWFTRKSLDQLTKNLIRDHSDTTQGMWLLGWVLYCQGKYKEAEEYFRKAYERRPEQWSERRWRKFLEYYSQTLVAQGKYGAAAEINIDGARSQDTDTDSIKSDKTGFKSADSTTMSAMKDNLRPRASSLP